MIMFSDLQELDVFQFEHDEEIWRVVFRFQNVIIYESLSRFVTEFMDSEVNFISVVPILSNF